MARSDFSENARSMSDTTPTILLQHHFASAKPLPSSHSRNRSPFSRPHLRSRSSGSAMNAPAMTRAHSMPAVNYARNTDSISPLSPPTTSTNLGSQSPQRSPARVRSPLSHEMAENSYFPPPRSPRWPDPTSAPIVAIQEDSELDLTPRNSLAFNSPIPPSAAISNRPSSSRRRPASPLYSVAMSSPVVTPVGQPDITSSPALAPVKYNEGFPASFSLHHYPSTSSFSSISSTPSSARSRSPSISSLDTIEDAPDAEYEAIEADRLWRLQLAEGADKADRAEDSGDEGHRRKGFGFGRGRTERKRWSVCGGERRADLDLETIWED